MDRLPASQPLLMKFRCDMLQSRRDSGPIAGKSIDEYRAGMGHGEHVYIGPNGLIELPALAAWEPRNNNFQRM